MMACNRDETADTLQASIDFIIEAKPNQFLFNFLTLCPGTKEFEIAEQTGRASKEMFFTKKNLYFSYFPEDAYDAKILEIIHWINTHSGIREFWDYSVSDRKQILEIFPNLSAAHMDLGRALYQAERFDEAKDCFQTAINLGFPMPGLGFNYLACMAFDGDRTKEAIDYLKQAHKIDRHHCVEQNLKILHDWLSKGMGKRNKPQLIAYHEFEPHHSTTQPISPAPITLFYSAASKPTRLVPQQ
jgi:tetratricopeptide (TPR) repeat protein